MASTVPTWKPNNGLSHDGRLMMVRTRTMGVKDNAYEHGVDSAQRSAHSAHDRPRVSYNEARNEPDPFPDPSLLDPLDNVQHEDIRANMDKLLETARGNGFPEEHWDTYHRIVHDHIDAFRVAFSHSQPAHLPPLRIDLRAEASPVKCSLRNYSPEQMIFMTDVVNRLVTAGMA